MSVLLTTVEVYTIQQYVHVLRMWSVMLRRRLLFKIYCMK